MVPIALLLGPAALSALLLLPALAFAQGPPAAPAPGAGGGDPFARSQLAELSAAPAPAGSPLVVRGFVDAGYVHITQQGGSSEVGGRYSWVYGNSQSTFSQQIDTIALNQVDLTLELERERDGVVYGGRASLDYFPSRDPVNYLGSELNREVQVRQGFAYVDLTRLWNLRFALGRWPGFMTLEQGESEPPDLRLIGHTYVFQAAGGYPYGFQLSLRPRDGLTFRAAVSNGGVGDYSFFGPDDSTLNRPVARREDPADPKSAADGRTGSGAIDWVPFDRPAGIGTLRLGVAAASNSALTYNMDLLRTESYQVQTAYLSYRVGDWEVRAERAKLDAYYELALGRFKAQMAHLLLSYDLGADHLFTLRGERISFDTALATWGTAGEARKAGATYRYRVGDGLVIKVEAVSEVQTPQFFQPTEQKELTTRVLSTSWVYAF